jgi:hypothetical protein
MLRICEGNSPGKTIQYYKFSVCLLPYWHSRSHSLSLFLSHGWKDFNTFSTSHSARKASDKLNIPTTNRDVFALNRKNSFLIVSQPQTFLTLLKPWFSQPRINLNFIIISMLNGVDKKIMFLQHSDFSSLKYYFYNSSALIYAIHSVNLQKKKSLFGRNETNIFLTFFTLAPCFDFTVSIAWKK